MGLHMKVEMEIILVNFKDHNIPDYQSDIVGTKS
jgi:hypothetical protein